MLTAGAANGAPVLEARGITKSFPGVRALQDVTLACRAGRVHGLLGENGAGKSTLVRVLTGNMQPDSGQLFLHGESVRFGDPRHAASAGVAAVYQELTVLPGMSVADNVMLGQERTRRGLLRRKEEERLVRGALARVGLGDIDIRQPAEALSLASQQLVEIARAWLRHSKLLILDEPSAVLAGDDLQRLFAIVRDLAAEGVSIVYISHRLAEVAELCDDITVLRDGKVVASGPVEEFDTGRIVREMVGRDVDAVFPSLPAAADVTVLEAAGVVPAGVTQAVPFDVRLRAGEIVGIAGLLGSGRSRMLRTIAGVARRAGGRINVDGRPVGRGVRAAIEAGVVFVPEERKTEGLVLQLPVQANVTLADLPAVGAHGILSRSKERDAYAAEQDRLRIRAAGPDQLTGQLSGGNQQKVVLAKWLRTNPKVLLLDEPTRGIDVGARAEIYRLIASFAEHGMAVLFASSDLPEVMGLAHRVLVCRHGQIVGELAGDDIDEEHIMHLALGTEEVSA